MDEGQSAKDLEVVPLTGDSIEKLALGVSTLKGCENIYSLDENVLLANNSKGGMHLIFVMLKECGDDVPLLRSVFLDNNSEYYSYVCDAAFKKMLSLCNSVGMLYLLYLSLPGDVAPNLNDDWHQKVVIEMIERCDGDLAQLSKLLRLFGGVPEFRQHIHVKINRVSKRSKRK